MDSIHLCKKMFYRKHVTTLYPSLAGSDVCSPTSSEADTVAMFSVCSQCRGTLKQNTGTSQSTAKRRHRSSSYYVGGQTRSHLNLRETAKSQCCSDPCRDEQDSERLGNLSMATQMSWDPNLRSPAFLPRLSLGLMVNHFLQWSRHAHRGGACATMLNTAFPSP